MNGKHRHSSPRSVPRYLASGAFSTLHLTSTAASDPPRSDQDQLQVDATRRVRAAGERALVLGGGESSGNAWLIGIIAGLFDAGVDMSEGSFDHRDVGRIDDRGPDRQRDADPTACRHPFRCTPATDWSGGSREWSRSKRAGMGEHLGKDQSDHPRRCGRGRHASPNGCGGAGNGWGVGRVCAETVARGLVAARLPSQALGRGVRFSIPAVDARTGEPVVFDRHSGVDLVDAVAASCCRWFRGNYTRYRRQPIHRRRLPRPT